MTKSLQWIDVSQALGEPNVWVQVRRKAIKSVVVRVDAVDASIHVSAPKWVALHQVSAFVHEQLDWIIAQRQAALRLRDSRPYQRLINGERVPLWGVHYPLQVRAAHGRSSIRRENHSVIMQVRSDSSVAMRLRLLDEWYRQQLHQAAWSLCRHYEPKLNVQVREIVVRRMKTLWGSCHVQRAKICLNRELVKLHPDCLEGVVAHEMTHLLERRHNGRFYRILSSVLPDWKTRDAKMARDILAIGGLTASDG